MDNNNNFPLYLTILPTSENKHLAIPTPSSEYNLSYYKWVGGA